MSKILMLFLVALSVATKDNGGLRGLLIDQDNRFSTSQTQAALWTIAIVFVLACLLLRRPFGATDDEFGRQFNALDETYLLLLGGPFAAWVVARRTGSAKLENKTIQKVSADEAQLKDLTTNDDGKSDLADTQFFLFSMLALLWFAATFASDPSGIPSLSTGLAALTSAGALVFIGNKAIAHDAPAISTIIRARGSGGVRPGDRIVIKGINFVPPGAGGDLDTLTRLTVRFGEHSVPVVPIVEGNASTAPEVRKAVRNPLPDRIEVDTPLNLKEKETTEVKIVTAAGAESDVYSLPIVEDKPIIREITPLPLTPSGKVTIRGQFFQPARFADSPRVWIDGELIPAASASDTNLTVVAPSQFSGATVSIQVESSIGTKSDTVQVSATS